MFSYLNPSLTHVIRFILVFHMESSAFIAGKIPYLKSTHTHAHIKKQQDFTLQVEVQAFSLLACETHHIRDTAKTPEIYM